MSRQLTGPVVIATHNPGKLKEMRELLAPYGIEAQSAGELGLAEPEETGKTFAQNARIKALAAAKATGQAAFADDSGLVVDALGGEPGIHSARWAGPDKDFRAAMNRIQTLLIERNARTPEQRRAHFIAALCLAWPDGHVEEFEGCVDGVVALAAARRCRLRLRSIVSARRVRSHVRADERARKSMGCRPRAKAFRIALAPSSPWPRLACAAIDAPSCAAKIHYNFNEFSAAKSPALWKPKREAA